MKIKLSILVIVVLSVFGIYNLRQPKSTAAQTPPPASIDWPMAGANPQRTSWTPEDLPGNIKTVWVKPIEPYVSQHVQVIGAENKVYVSTSKGLYAFDANTGSQVWVYPTELPLGHSPTYDNGFLYVGGMDRKIHKVNAATGEGVWSYISGGGFYTNPVVTGGLVYAGNRDGAFYAVSTESGQLVWKYQTGSQIQQSAAYSEGTLYFASNDGYAYALSATDGSLIWKSANKLPGMGQYSWWPVLYQNNVIFTRTPFEGGLFGVETAWLFCPPGSTTCSIPSNRIPGTFVSAENEISNQPTMDVSTNPNGSSFPNYFETFPHRRNAVFFNRTTGAEVPFDLDNDGAPDAAPISWVGDAGTPYPPLVSGFDNVLYFRTVNRTNGISFSSATISGWNVGTPYLNLPFSSMSGQSGAMPQDEPVGISGGGNKIYWNLCCDRFVGSVDLSQRNTNFFSNTDDSNRQWRYITSTGLPFYTTPSNIGMPVNYYQEATKFFWDPPHPAMFWNENDKVGPAIYQGKVYVILGNALVAFAEGGAGSNAPVLTPAAIADTQPSNPYHTRADILVKLETEVAEIIAAGHLKPSYSYVGLLSPQMGSKLDDRGLEYWHNPADIHLVLLRALPHLSENLQLQVKTYLQSEMANFSPIQYSHIGWTSGTQRDPYSYPPTDGKLFNLNFGPIDFVSFSGWSQPPHNIYAVWKYAQAGLGDPQVLFSQIQNKLKPQITLIKASLTDSYLAAYPHVHNAYISGYIGYIELAKLAGQSPSVYQPFQDELDRLLILRAQNLTVFPTPNTGNNNANLYFKTAITMWNFMYLTPELADYLYENAQTNVLDILNTYLSIAPYWMVAINGETQGENALMPYQQTHSLFQALAQVKGASFDELLKYLDTPIVPTGDLYHIDNLVAVIEAEAVTPPVTYIGDANADTHVDQADYDIWIANYNTITTEGESKGDFNLDTTVDGIDYVIWFDSYGL